MSLWPVVNRWSLGGGTLAWLLVWLLNLVGALHIDTFNLLILLALLVTMPLALPLAQPAEQLALAQRLFALLVVAQPLAALLALIGLLLPSGWLAALLSTPWLLLTAGLALLALLRLLAGDWHQLEELCVDAGLAYLIIGGVWLVISRLGLKPMGFSPAIVALTAVHFHFISLAGLVGTGMLGRLLCTTRGRLPRLYQAATWIAMVCPALIALGITFWHLLEGAAAIIFAADMVIIALLLLRSAATAVRAPLARWLLLAAALCLVVAMAFATLYALARVNNTYSAWLTIQRMLRVHGWVNALGFSLLSLLGWRVATAQIRRAT